MAFPIFLKKEPLRIVLDGPISVGKTAWLKSLTTGNYRKEKHTVKVSQEQEYVAVVKGKNYETVIYDTNGEEKVQYENREIYEKADVIIEFFSIERPSTLCKVLERRISFIGFFFPNTPILLVGTMSDLKNVPNPQKSYFPSAFGPFLANHVGAFRYVECSALKNFNVQKVIEEAIWAASTASSRMRHESDVYQDVNAMVIDKVFPEGQWLEIINSFHGTKTTVGFQKDIDMLNRQFTQFGSITWDHPSFKGLYIIRNLELERILISYSRTKRFLSQQLQPTCALWYTPETTEEQSDFLVFQSSSDKAFCDMNTLSNEGKDSSINLFVVKQEFTQVAELLTKNRNLRIRSLVIVGCKEVLNFSFLSQLDGLEYLVIKDSLVNIETLNFPHCFSDTMKHLVLNGCGISEPTEVPSVIAKLKKLELLNIAKNNFESLAPALRCLRNLHLLMIDKGNMVSPSTEELDESPQEILSVLAPKPEDFLENKEAKLVFVGQNGVGKTTLIRTLENTTAVGGVVGPQISILHLINGVKCNVYNLVGDVEYLNTGLVRSSNSLNVVVFDLSQVTLNQNVRLEYNICRLGLWLEALASDPKDPTSYVIIVGTHADASSVCEDIIKINRMFIMKLLRAYGPRHGQTNNCERCILCNADLAPDSLQQTSDDINTPENASAKAIPHILGYHEVSEKKKRDTGVKELKSQLNGCVDYLMKESRSENVLTNWVSLRSTLQKQMSQSPALKKEPMIPLSRINELAADEEIYDEDEVKAMLRFFHSQGTFLWYENLPEMKDIVILDPQWLSDPLRTLISHSPTLSSICDGVLHLSELSKVWTEMSKENQQKLLALFRSVGLCFSISDTEELFPYYLPVGWPDQEIWPTLPEEGESQTSLLFEFSFVPPSFFPELIVEISKKNKTFAMKPLYYRFHIIYITKNQGPSTYLDDVKPCAKDDASSAEDDDVCLPTQNLPALHKVHYEFMPYNNSLTVAVRGPDPPCIIPDIRSTIEAVIHPEITHNESILCPKCVMKRVQPPSSFRNDTPHNGICSRGHIVGSNERIFGGKYSSNAVAVTPAAVRTRQVVGQTLEDHVCPKHFVIIPRNFGKELSFLERCVKSKVRDGFTLHLLCECPDQWHFVDSPGFPVARTTEFINKHGEDLIRALSTLKTIFYAVGAAPLHPLKVLAIPIGLGAHSLEKYFESIRSLLLDKYPELKQSLDCFKDDLQNLKSSSGLKRSELSKFLNVRAKGRDFGPLVWTYVEKRDEWLWLCKEHNKRFEIVHKVVTNQNIFDGK